MLLSSTLTLGIDEILFLYWKQRLETNKKLLKNIKFFVFRHNFKTALKVYLKI